MKISFIIPAYNAEKLIEKCVNSILTQDVDENLYEIILVNDGSKDNTQQICEELERTHFSVRQFTNENHGPGFSRNFGMYKAKGDYIWFIDADDYLEVNILSSIVSEMNDNLDLYMVGYQFIDIKGEEIKKRKFKTEILTPTESLNKEYYINYVWCKLIKRSVLKENNISFKEDIRGPEDFHLSFRLLHKIEKLKTIEVLSYIYIRQPNSLMTSRSEAHMQKLAEDSIIVGNELRELINMMENKKTKKAFDLWLNNYLFGLYFSLFRFNYKYSYVASTVKALSKNQNYPIKLSKHDWKRKLFTTFINAKPVFLSAVWLRRNLVRSV